MITLKNVTKKFKNSDDEIALNNVSATFEKGFIHGIIGISGAGKSTLIRLLNKLETSDQGDIQVLEYNDIRELNKESTRMLRKRIGMIFQSDHLLSRKTVLENVLFPITLHRKLEENDYQYAKEIIKEVALEGYENRYPSQLSGGQRQRVGIARVLMNKPEILLCDEPTSALDVITTGQILQLIKSVSIKHNITVIIVTHDMNVVKKICDTVTVMDKGLIVEHGLVQDIMFKAKHPQTRAFIKEVGLDLESIITEKNKERLLLLSFDKDVVHEAIISKMTNDLSVKTSIVYANISPNQNGVMLLDVDSKKEEVISYLEKELVVVNHVI